MTNETKAKLVSLLLAEEDKLLDFAKKQEFPVDSAIRNYALNFQSVEPASCIRPQLLSCFCGALIFFLDNKYGECCSKSSTVEYRMGVMINYMTMLQSDSLSDDDINARLKRM